jgi:hypothetical protein
MAIFKKFLNNVLENLQRAEAKQEPDKEQITRAARMLRLPEVGQGVDS